MKIKQNIGSIALLFVAPLATGLSAGIAPSNAATLANSTAEVTIDNFSHRPNDTGRSTATDTQTVSFDGLAVAAANANAAFIVNCHQLLAQNLSESQVSGTGDRYTGTARSQASVIGDFSLDAEETFSFAFQSVLRSLIAVDRPESERAIASGKISFWLIDTVTSILLDSFELVST
ncbi:MAG: PEP-CTERM sorting domain-containing protein, partial [Microcoleus sp.]